MLARLTAFLVWALVAATAVFWGLRLLVRPPAAPAHTVGDASALRGDLTRLLGATPSAPSAAAAPAPELASRFKLLGVMASKQTQGEGFALIAVDAKPARAYAVGAPLDGDLVLKSVGLRTAAIGPAQGAPALTLEVPALPAAATGALPPLADGLKFGAAATPVPGMPAPAPAPAPAPLPMAVPSQSPSSVMPPTSGDPGPASGSAAVPLRPRAPGAATR
jgi:general secretion pathway protein C